MKQTLYFDRPINGSDIAGVLGDAARGINLAFCEYSIPGPRQRRGFWLYPNERVIPEPDPVTTPVSDDEFQNREDPRESFLALLGQPFAGIGTPEEALLGYGQSLIRPLLHEEDEVLHEYRQVFPGGLNFVVKQHFEGFASAFDPIYSPAILILGIDPDRSYSELQVDLRYSVTNDWRDSQSTETRYCDRSPGDGGYQSLVEFLDNLQRKLRGEPVERQLAIPGGGESVLF